jgi:hypothetical protein
MIGAISVAVGCGAPPRPFLPGFYSPAKIDPFRGALPAVAVYAFSDDRATDPTLIMESGGLRGERRRDYATEPVADGVVRAFVDGFRARGFPVADMTAKPYAPDASSGDARIAISGRVLQFGALILRSGLVGFDQRVVCRIDLEAREAATGRSVWTKSYSELTQGPALPADPMTVLSRALAKVIEQAVTDPELLAVVLR